MKDKELKQKAKEIILQGAKQVNIELPEFEVDIDWGYDRLISAVKHEDYATCIGSSFEWSETPEGNDYWLSVFDKFNNI